MFDNQITLVGNLVDEVSVKFTGSGQAVANFRVASTPRFRDQQTGEWKDGESLFIDCTAWRRLAENLADSDGFTKGTRVVIVGRLRQRSYEHNDERRTVYEVEVDEVTPSLRNATVTVKRAQRTAADGNGQPARLRAVDESPF